MLLVTAGNRRLCDGLSRRELLSVGAAGAIGLTLPRLLAAASTSMKPRAKSLILFVLEGGPAHQDLWDMKPDAPAEIRGEFKPIATTVPGLSLCEHLPLLATQAHHLTLVRSVHHTIADHNAGAIFALTGREPLKSGQLITAPAPDNFPPMGAVLAKLRPTGTPLPAFIHTPDWMSNNGSFLPGQDSGFLGAAFNPFVAGDPSRPGYRVPGLDLPKELSLERVTLRRSLLESLNPCAPATARPWPGSTRTTARRIRSSPRRPPAAPSTSPASPPPSASALASTSTTREKKKLASSAACHTWANACCSRGA